jgi:hypothetical protein
LPWPSTTPLPFKTVFYTAHKTTGLTPWSFTPEERMTQEQEAEHLDVHVAVCAERYKSLEKRLDRIERVMWWMLTTLIMALGGMAFELVALIGRKII